MPIFWLDPHDAYANTSSARALRYVVGWLPTIVVLAVLLAVVFTVGASIRADLWDATFGRVVHALGQ